jgi:hypothetical protein
MNIKDNFAETTSDKTAVTLLGIKANHQFEDHVTHASKD